MEPTTPATPSASSGQTTQANTTAPQQPVKMKKSGGFFAFLGKIFLILLVAGALLGGGYYFGMTGKSNTLNPTPSLTQTPISPTSPITPTSTPSNVKVVKAGLLGSTSFKPYSIVLPEGWTDVRENTQSAEIDKLTISKNGYTLTIYQAAIGGGGCLYKGDAPAQMAQSFTDFADVKGAIEQYRRSWNAQDGTKTISYTICQKAADNSYGSITTYGAISAVSPNPAEPTILAEIDSMIASLTKQ